nr:transposase [uncultured Blautia sp.]
MSFRTNDCQQISLNDKLMNLTEREKKALNKSWAKVFADEIFPAIDEERFSVLYSDKASRPDTPVNVIIGALIIKELSDKTLSRFRKRCYDHETLHGVDLYRDCVKDLSGKIAKIMKLNGRIRRMDFMMIESNIRFLSRMELIYTCISKLIVYLTKNASDKVSEQLKHYADSNDYNRIFYHQRNDDMENIIQMLLTDSDSLLEICKTDFEEVTEYQLFVRCLSEQTVVENEKRRLRTKEDGTMNSSALQNPSDPDATYRKKSGKLYRGYAANLEETVGKNGSVITDYQFDKNTHTDSHFLQDTLSAMEKSEEEIILITDGGYDGQDNIALAKEKNVKLVTTALARLRNGVETIPANIRKNYHLDKLPRGKQRGKFFFGSKIAALNFRKLFGFRKGLGNYAPNPVLV